MKKFILSLCLVAMTAKATYVLFPLNQMFGGQTYTKTFTITATPYNLLSDTNSNSFYVGQTGSITPIGGTNPIVWLEPNVYTVIFPDSSYNLIFSVPNSTNVINLWNIVTNYPPSYAGVIAPFPTYLGGTNIIIQPIGNNQFLVSVGTNGGGGSGVSSWTNLNNAPYVITLTNQTGNITFNPLSTNIVGNVTNVLLDMEGPTNGINGFEAVITNTTGPHGWTNFYFYGVVTNRTSF